MSHLFSSLLGYLPWAFCCPSCPFRSLCVALIVSSPWLLDSDIQSPSDWLQVPSVKIRHLGGSSLLVYYGIAKLLQIAYPHAEIDWEAEATRRLPGTDCVCWGEDVRREGEGERREQGRELRGEGNVGTKALPFSVVVFFYPYTQQQQQCCRQDAELFAASDQQAIARRVQVIFQL